MGEDKVAPANNASRRAAEESNGEVDDPAASIQSSKGGGGNTAVERDPDGTNDIEKASFKKSTIANTTSSMNEDALTAAIRASLVQESNDRRHQNDENNETLAAVITRSLYDIRPGAFREGFMEEEGEDEESATVQSSTTHREPVAQDEPYMAVAKIVVEPELVTATRQDSTEPGAGVLKQGSQPCISKRSVLLLILLASLVVIGLVSGIVVSRNNREEEALLQGQSNDNDKVGESTAAPTVAAAMSTTPRPTPETFEMLGNFTDAEEGGEPDLSSLKVSVSRSRVAFDLTYKDSESKDPFTFLIDMKTESGNLDQLELSSSGEWTLSRLDPREEVTSGTYIVVASDADKKNARIEVDRIHLQDLFSKEVSVYCETSDDRMPDNNSSIPSYYTLKETSTGTLAKVSDPLGGADPPLDFASFKVYASEDWVTLNLEFNSDTVPLFTISLEGPHGIGPSDTLTVNGNSASWGRRRSLQEEDIDSISVGYEEGSCDPVDTECVEDGAEISFPRGRIPDLMTRLVSVQSEVSQDRIPDTGSILLSDEQGRRW